MKKYSILSIAVIAVICSSVTGCVDNNYDASEDIDLTVSVGGGLSVPMGSTEKITMKEMMDIKEGDVLKTKENGDYYFYKKDDIDRTDYSVEPFALNYEIEDNVETGTFEMERIEGIEYLDDGTKYPYKISTNLHFNVNIKTNNSNRAPKEVRDIYLLSGIEGGEIDVTISLEADNALMTLDTLYLGDKGNPFLTAFPKYITFKEGQGIDPANNTLELTGKYLLRDSNSSDCKFIFNRKLTVESFDFEEGKMHWDNNTEEHPVDLSDSIVTKGLVYSDAMMLTLTEAQNLTFDYELTQSIEDIDITVNEIEGRFDPQIEPIDQRFDLDLNSDLDFLKEEEAVLDLKDPIIYIDLYNPVSVPIRATVAMSGYRTDNGGETLVAGSEIGFEVEIEKKGTNKYIVSRSGVTEEGYTAVLVENLNDLLRRLPDEVHMYIRPEAIWEEGTNGPDNPHRIAFGDMYIDGNYAVDVPLNFEEFRVKYTETTDDVLGDDPTETTDYLKNVKKITITLTADNTAPLELDLAVEAYRADGSTKLSNIDIDVDKTILRGNGHERKPVSTDITVTFKAENNELEDLNTIKFIVTGTGAGLLNENDYIVLKNMKVHIDEPLEIDMNDK